MSQRAICARPLRASGPSIERKTIDRKTFVLHESCGRMGRRGGRLPRRDAVLDEVVSGRASARVRKGNGWGNRLAGRLPDSRDEAGGKTEKT